MIGKYQPDREIMHNISMYGSTSFVCSINPKYTKAALIFRINDENKIENPISNSKKSSIDLIWTRYNFLLRACMLAHLNIRTGTLILNTDGHTFPIYDKCYHITATKVDFHNVEALSTDEFNSTILYITWRNGVKHFHWFCCCSFTSINLAFTTKRRLFRAKAIRLYLLTEISLLKNI